jgi:hypothetical protein
VSEDEVFRAPPKEFTSARDAYAKKLKDEGKKDEAKAVKGWRRPPLPVWLWNRLILDGDEHAKKIVQVAGAIAKAIEGKQSTANEVAELRSEGTELLKRARNLAAEVGAGFSIAQERELIELVQALPWSEAARETAAKGRLHDAPPPIDPLEAMRLAAGAPPLPQAEEKDEPEIDPRELKKAEHAVNNAQSELDVARASLEEARVEVSRAESRVSTAEDRLAAAEAHLRSLSTASRNR